MSYDKFQEMLLRFIYHMGAAISNVRLFGVDHPYVDQYIDSAYAELANFINVYKSLTLFIIADRIVVNDRHLTVSLPFLEKFIVILREKGVERVTFSEGLTKYEVLDFLVSIAATDVVPIRSSRCIRLGKVKLKDFVEADDVKDLEAFEQSEIVEKGIPHGNSELDRIRDLYHTVERRKRLDVRGVEEVVSRFITGFLWNINPISLLASVKVADEYTFTHAVNVGILTIIQARNLGYSGRVLHEIGTASMLHDVGKIFVPSDILSKPGGLTSEERAIIERHTVKGGRYLMTLEGIPKIAVIAALEHHLKYDGSGYPHIKPGWRPNLVGQMITIADVFDALRSKRAYSNPKPLREIVRIFEKEKGTTFNPLLVDSFLRLIKRDTLWTAGVAEVA